MRRQAVILLIGIVLSVMALDSCTPQLGRSSDERVVAAMTREEKVRLLVGTCKDWNLVPEPAPATIHRPPAPDGYWDNARWVLG